MHTLCSSPMSSRPTKNAMTESVKDVPVDEEIRTTAVC